MSKGHEGLKRESGALDGAGDAKVMLESTVDSSSFLVVNLLCPVPLMSCDLPSFAKLS
jgi:hypothetical protein